MSDYQPTRVIPGTVYQVVRLLGQGGMGTVYEVEDTTIGKSYVLKTLPHYVQNTGDTDLKFLEMFKSGYYQDLALSEWLTHTPLELVMAHLGIDKATLDSMPKDAVVVMPR